MEIIEIPIIVLIIVLAYVILSLGACVLQVQINKQAEKDYDEYDKKQCETIKNLELEILKLKDEIDRLTLENHDLKEEIKDAKH